MITMRGILGSSELPNSSSSTTRHHHVVMPSPSASIPLHLLVASHGIGLFVLYAALALHKSFLELFGSKEERILSSTWYVAVLVTIVLNCMYIVVFLVASPRLRKMLLVCGLLILLFISFSLYGIHHGTMNWWTAAATCVNKPMDVTYYFMTIPRNIDRKYAFEARMNKAGICNPICKPIMGIDAKEFTSTKELLEANNVQVRDAVTPPPEVRSFVAVTMGVQHALNHMAKDAQTEWVVLFEDDAAVFSHFETYLRQAMCEYEAMDMIWLDTRNAANWFFLRRLDGGSNAICYKRSSADRIAALLDFNSEFMTKARLQNGYDTGRHRFDGTGIDVSLARMCNDGLMKCASVPLVVESGAPKTTEWGNG